jgi:hypothetical protein
MLQKVSHHADEGLLVPAQRKGRQKRSAEKTSNNGKFDEFHNGFLLL